MDTTWLEFGPVAVRAPVSAGTNLVLAIQCAIYGRALRRVDDAPMRAWGAFFLAMFAATLAGVVKHGGRHLLDAEGLTLVLAICNMGAGVAVYFAQQGVARPRSGQARLCRPWLPAAQLAAFIGANLALGPEIWLVIVHTAMGLIPSIAAEAACARTVPGAGRVAAGLSVSLLSGLPYVLGLSLSRWFNHIDLTHVTMGVGFTLLWSGLARRRAASWT